MSVHLEFSAESAFGDVTLVFRDTYYQQEGKCFLCEEYWPIRLAGNMEWNKDFHLCCPACEFQERTGRSPDEFIVSNYEYIT